jgi:beta-lactamase class C
MSARILATTSLALVCACHPPARMRQTDDVPAIRTFVDSAVHEVMAEYDIPGVAVAATADGRLMFFNYGVASRESGTPIDDATLFEIGSDSKAFTATLAAYAQATGSLSLKDHPGKYIPQLRGSAIDDATLLDLGAFTAGGLPLQFPEAVSDSTQILEYFRSWRSDAAPGTERRYSNPSVGLLGHITALAMRSSFADAVETQLLPKLGLAHSYIRVPQAASAHYAWGYNSRNQPVRVTPGALDAEAYGVKSTPADMIRFVALNIDPSSLDVAMQHAIEGTHIGYYKIGDMVQGLGWEQYRYPVTLARLQAGNSPAVSMEANRATRIQPQEPRGATLFNKTGSTNGFGAYVAFVPQKKVGIVVLANKNYPIDARIRVAYGILQRLAR